MIVFTEIPLYLETTGKLVLHRTTHLLHRYSDSRCPCTVRQRCIIVHFVLKNRVLSLLCVYHIADFGWRFPDCYWGEDEIELILFENLAILVYQQPSNLLGLYHFLIKIFETRGQEEIA